VNFAILEGSTRFVKHWLFWHSKVGVFNEQNPSGEIVHNEYYQRILISLIFCGAVASIKRLWLGLYLGRKTYWNYAEELAKVMKKILLLCEVASLAQSFESDAALKKSGYCEIPTVEHYGISRDNFERIVQEYDDEDPPARGEIDETLSRSQNARNAVVIDPTEYNSSGGLTDVQKSKITELLGEWEVRAL
jgi:hypothetical protein